MCREPGVGVAGRRIDCTRRSLASIEEVSFESEDQPERREREKGRTDTSRASWPTSRLGLTATLSVPACYHAHLHESLSHLQTCPPRANSSWIPRCAYRPINTFYRFTASTSLSQDDLSSPERSLCDGGRCSGGRRAISRSRILGDLLSATETVQPRSWHVLILDRCLSIFGEAFG